MTRNNSKGLCTFCQTEYSKSGMSRHLETCKQRRLLEALAEEQHPAQRTRKLHVLIEGERLPMYWMHLDITAAVSLATVDQFLRDTWLECCGHLSAFEIDGLRYVGEEGFTDWGEGRERTMQIACADVLHPGRTCSYEYDFGSTTELTIKVISERDVVVAGKLITVLARNTLPPVPCDTCGKPATGVCWEWLDDNEVGVSLCATCAKAHACGERSLVPLVNSPREGVCGYTGPASPYRW